MKKIRFDAISQSGTFNPFPFLRTSTREMKMQTRFITGENIQPNMVDNSTKGWGIILSAFVYRIIIHNTKNTLQIKATRWRNNSLLNLLFTCSMR